jgi:hypothetical protein
MRSIEAVTEPFLFIAGVSKAGTTSLFDYLRAHPGVSASRPKEPFYFVPADFYFNPPLRYGRDPLERFLALFPSGSATQVRLEGSSLYFMVPSIATKLDRIFSDLRVVISLREPVARLVSCYQMAQFHEWLPPSVTLDSYLRQMLDDANRLPYNQCDEGRYSVRLSRWFGALGRERVKVVWFDDLLRDPRRVVQGIARFRGLDPSFYASYRFEKSNVGKVVRSPAVRRAYRGAKKLVSRMAKPGSASRRWLRRLDRRLHPVVERLNTRFPSAPRVDPVLLTRLRDYYRGDLEPLARLTGSVVPWADKYEHPAAEALLGAHS